MVAKVKVLVHQRAQDVLVTFPYGFLEHAVGLGVTRIGELKLICRVWVITLSPRLIAGQCGCLGVPADLLDDVGGLRVDAGDGLDLATRLFLSHALVTFRPLRGQPGLFKQMPFHCRTVVLGLEGKDAFLLAGVANQKVSGDTAAQIVDAGFGVALKAGESMGTFWRFLMPRYRQSRTP